MRHLLDDFVARAKALLPSTHSADNEPLEVLLDRLLSKESGSAKLQAAATVAARFEAADDDGKRQFLALLSERYNADPERLDRAITRYREHADAETLAELHAASEPRRQQILRQLNQLPHGTAMLVGMRREAFRIARDLPDFSALDTDFAHLFASWFNGGFLKLERLDWSSSGTVLAKLIDYEAVHEINSWAELRARLEPADRRCYAFFHPQMPGEPLIFVEVALTGGIPDNIGEMLRLGRPIMEPADATTAVFYSISNCQAGLRGIPFGSTLIKQVVDLLKAELPGLRRFVTLSPLPGFARWLERMAQTSEPDAALFAQVSEPEWRDDPDKAETLKGPLLRAAASYLLNEHGRGADPVARFHLGNGARIEQLDWLADVSPKGMLQSYGIMVNYLYDLRHIDDNYRAYFNEGKISAASSIQRMARTEPSPPQNGGPKFPRLTDSLTRKRA